MMNCFRFCFNFAFEFSVRRYKLVTAGGMTAVMHASQKGMVDAISALAACGASLHQQTVRPSAQSRALAVVGRCSSTVSKPMLKAQRLYYNMINCFKLWRSIFQLRVNLNLRPYSAVSNGAAPVPQHTALISAVIGGQKASIHALVDSAETADFETLVGRCRLTQD